MAQRKQAFYAGANPMRLFDVASGDGELLSGFDADASVTASEADSVQTVATDDQGDGVAHEPILFPFEGASLMLRLIFLMPRFGLISAFGF